MLKTILKTSGLLVCLLAFNTVHALGLGGIVVSSNLGQPLRAEIELVAVDKADRPGIQARLAPTDAFKSAGIDYPYGLPRLTFEVVDRDTDQPRIRITSAQPVNEPFVTLLIEVVWSSGKLMREYTFLLDPVGFNLPAQPAEVIPPLAPVVSAATATVSAEPVAAPAAMEVPAVPEAEGAIPEPEGETATAPVAPPGAVSEPETEKPTWTPGRPSAAAEKAESVPAAAEAPKESEGPDKEGPTYRVEAPSASIAVVRGDSLSKIALKIKPAEVSLERMLLAMYRANTGAFIGKNMNRLMAGKVIRLPDAAEIDAIDQKEARREYRAHVKDWNAYRQQLAAARAPATESAAEHTASGKVTASVAEAPAAAEPAKEVLKLSKGEAPGSAVDAEKSSSKQEDAVAREKSLQDAQERTALLEKNVKDLERLAELKKQQAATATADMAASAAAVTAGDGAAVKPAEKPVAIPAVPAPVPVTEIPEPSFLDVLLEDPVLLGGGACAVLLLLGGGLWLSRRRTVRPAKSMAIDGSDTGRITEPVISSPETGDFTQTHAAVDEAEKPASDEVDPLAEADLFLSFGRDTQAEEVLKDALSSRPGDLPILLKLLSIYASRKDANAFLTYARQVKDSGDESAWDQACAMGRELEPNNPLYGVAGEAGVAPSDATESGADPVVDFDLGFGGEEKPQPTDFLDTEIMSAVEPATQSKEAEPPNLFDSMTVETPEQEITAILSPEELRAAQETPMDFDVTGSPPPGGTRVPAEKESDADDLIFDVTSTNPGFAASTTSVTASDVPQKDTEDLIFDIAGSKPDIPATTRPTADEMPAFTLDIPESSKPAAETGPDLPPDVGLADISLNLGGETADGLAAALGSKDERWQEVATKLDLAKAYQEMGDAAGAREILEEVLRDGDEQQRVGAQSMLDQL